MPIDSSLPFPPLEMRKLVGPTATTAFDNPKGEFVFKDIPAKNYQSILDFGCGCGRVARQLIQQEHCPEHYIGVDIHAGMINWCRENLTPAAPGFNFIHHDVFNLGLNPGKDKPLFHSLPVEDRTISLMVAWSVFTHLLESQTEFYLQEAARVLRPDGILWSTWFLFDKRNFPMMQEFQNALFINHIDPSNAVVFDYFWLTRKVNKLGMKIVYIAPPAVKGFQWVLHIVPEESHLTEAKFPEDITSGVLPVDTDQ
jgi:SAM-dependent methyltransferase